MKKKILILESKQSIISIVNLRKPASMYICLIFLMCCRSSQILKLRQTFGGIPGGSVVGNLLANIGDTGLIPNPGRSHMLRSN